MRSRPMLPLSYAATRAWLIHWDKFVLPWPGSRIAIAIGAPCSVPRGTDAAGIERIQSELAALLHKTFQSARQALAEAKSTW